jgi:hypothetical protein
MSATAIGRDRRVHERTEVRLSVDFGIDEPDRSAIAENISEGGLYLNTNDVSKPGTILTLRIEFPKRLVTLRCEVIWAIQAPEPMRDSLMCGMGIRFLNPDPGWQVFYREWNSDWADIVARGD